MADEPSPAPSRIPAPRAVTLVVIALAALVRYLIATRANLSFESDEAIVGLMARHILYQGERPAFYYGQSYLGPLEPATAALSFLVFGPTMPALRLVPIAYSLVFVWFSAKIARQAFGEVAALACLAYLALPPLFLLTWSIKARGGYPEAIALGMVVLWLTIDLVLRPDGDSWRWPILGATAGLAFWTDPLAVVFLVPGGLYALFHLHRELLGWRAAATLAAFVAAVLPMLFANVASGGATFRELALQNTSQSRSLLDLRHNLSLVVRESIPVLLGFFQASSDRPSFANAVRLSGELAIVGPIVAAAVLLGIALGGLESLRHLARRKPRPVDLLIWVAIATITLFVASRSQIIFTTEPRYLLPLYALVPVGAAIWSRLWSWNRPAALLALGLVLGLNVASIARFDPGLAAPILDGQVVRADDPGLAQYLGARGINALYTDYWIAYPIAFLSGETIVPAVIDEHLAIGFNRYVPYAIAVDRQDAPAVIVVAGSPAERRLGDWLAARGASYQVGRWGKLDVYDHLDPPFRPSTV